MQKLKNCCKMTPDEDTEWPNIPKCSFFQALTLYKSSCFPPKTQDWLDIGSYAPALCWLTDTFFVVTSDKISCCIGSKMINIKGLCQTTSHNIPCKKTAYN